MSSSTKLCRAFAYISLIQILGLVVAVVAAAVDIESIMVTGPILSFTGMIVALGWRFCRSVLVGAFGLSAPAMSVFLLLLINVLRWSPSDAQLPVTSILIGYELLVTPIALAGLYKALTRSGDEKNHSPFQFSLRSLVLASIFIGAVYAGIQILENSGCEILLAVSIGLAVAILIAVTGTLAYCVCKQTHSVQPQRRA